MFIKKWFERHFSKTKKYKKKNKGAIDIEQDNCRNTSSSDNNNPALIINSTNTEGLNISTLVKNSILIEHYFYPEDIQHNNSSIISFNQSQILASENSDNIRIEWMQANNSANPISLDNKNYTIEDFEKVKLIGRGYYGKVYVVKNKKDNKIYALKSLNKEKIRKEKEIEHLQYEKKILELVNHPFIMELKAIMQAEKKIYILSEYYSGGELFYHLRTLNTFSHELTQFYFAQIVLTIDFLHSKNIIYRDLKPENIVLDSSGYLKLTDFGLAKDNINEHCSTSTFCGTSEYLAPEIIIGDNYGKPVDIWCMGIILFEMYIGIPPFFDSNKEKLFKKIMFSEIDFKLNKKVHLSDDCRDLIMCMLDKNQKTRLKIHQVKTHPYFKNFSFRDLMDKTMLPPFVPQYIEGNEAKIKDVKEMKHDTDINVSEDNISTKSEEKIMKKNYSGAGSI